MCVDDRQAVLKGAQVLGGGGFPHGKRSACVARRHIGNPDQRGWSSAPSASRRSSARFRSGEDQPVRRSSRGGRELLDCVVREVHEELGVYLPPERFELIGHYTGPDHDAPDRLVRGQLFLARQVPLDRLTVTEGSLEIVALHELDRIRDRLAPPAKFALEIFLKREKPAGPTCSSGSHGSSAA